VRAPVHSGTHAVVLSVPDEATLVALSECLALHQIDHVLIREPDEPWQGAAMAIGLSPVIDRRKVRRVLGQLPLLR